MTEPTTRFAHKHLLSISDLSTEDMGQLLDWAEAFYEFGEKDVKKIPTLRGKTVLNVFLENSTRTRLSFEIAAKRMSADAVNMSGSGSSTAKGESLLDTARNLNAMRPSIIVLRHKASGAAEKISKLVDCSVVNAGDGMHEHPTQALLDLSTICRHKGRSSLASLKVAIVGDIEHSRVARSNVLSLTAFGTHVVLCAPDTLIPRGIESLADGLKGTCRTTSRLEDAIDDADVVMMLRVQNERLGGTPRFANNREYSRFFGLNNKTLALSKDDAIVMHPGPINRGVEMMPDVADGLRSVILEQVTRGVALRMAVLHAVNGGELNLG